jgi:hypothetical protein
MGEPCGCAVVGGFLLGAMCWGPPAWAAPVGSWSTVETERVRVHHTLANAGTAARVAELADEAWLRIADETGFFPTEVLDVVIREGDVPRGAIHGDRVVFDASSEPGTIRVALARGLGRILLDKSGAALSETFPDGALLTTSGERLGSDLFVQVAIGPIRPDWWTAGAPPTLAERIGFEHWDAGDEGLLRAVADRFESVPDLVALPRDEAEAVSRDFVKWLIGEHGSAAVFALANTVRARPLGGWPAAFRGMTGERIDASRARHWAWVRQRRVPSADRVEGEPGEPWTLDPAQTLFAARHPDVEAPDRWVTSEHWMHQTNLWMHRRGSEPVRLTRDGWAEVSPVWSQTGIFFAADVHGRMDVFRLDPDSGLVVQVSRTGTGLRPVGVDEAGHLHCTRVEQGGDRAVVLRAEHMLALPAPMFRTDGAHGDRAERTQHPPVPTMGAPYRPTRAWLRPTASPWFRLEEGAAGLEPLGGVTVELRDALDTVRLSGDALVGIDVRFAGAVEVGRSAFAGRSWGLFEHDRAAVARVGPYALRVLLKGGAGLVWRSGSATTLGLELEGRSLRRPFTNDDGAIRSAALTSRARWSGRSWTLRAAAAPALGAADRATVPFGIGSFALGGRPRLFGPVRLTLGLQTASIFGQPHPEERPRMGGGSPSPIRLGQLGPTLSFAPIPALWWTGSTLGSGAAGLDIQAPPIQLDLGPVRLRRLSAEVQGLLGALVPGSSQATLHPAWQGTLRASGDVFRRPMQTAFVLAGLVDGPEELPPMRWVLSVGTPL